jgi:thiamine pyrophosphate-dependent acetolactate synthase large subunit-like protein
MMPKIEYDLEAQKNLKVPLGEREIYPNAGMLIAQTLKEQGVTVAFGVPGGHIWAMVDPISRIGIHTVIPGHEQTAPYMAEAYAQVTGKTGVVFVTAGPGTTNATSGVQQALLSGTPMVILTGGHELVHEKMFNCLQEDFTQEVMGGITKWTQRLTEIPQIQQFLTRGFKLANTAQKGPVVFNILTTMLMQPIPAWVRQAEYIPAWRGTKTTERIAGGGNPDDIAEAVKRLYAVDKPFLIIGDDPCWDKAGEELEELVTLAKIPFTTRRLGRGVVNERHPYCTRGLPSFRKEIELMIPVGLKVGFFDGFGAGWPETIQIAASEALIWTHLPTSVALVGSTKVIARQMIDYIKANNLTPSAGRDEWIKRIQDNEVASAKKRSDRALKYKDMPRYKKMIHHGYLSKAITDFLEERYQSRNRVVLDGFSISGYIMPYFTAVRPAQILTASEQAGIGHGIGMSIGAAIGDLEANPADRTPVVAMMGDAGMGVDGMNVEVAARFKLPIVYIVTNNNGWLTGMKYRYYGEKWNNYGDQDNMGAAWLGNVIEAGPEKVDAVRWDQVFAPFGTYGETISSHDEILPALERCFDAAEKGQPAILNCMVDKTICNPAMDTPLYSISFAHIPFDEISEQGKAARIKFWGKSPYMSGLAKEEPRELKDVWDPIED